MPPVPTSKATDKATWKMMKQMRQRAKEEKMLRRVAKLEANDVEEQLKEAPLHVLERPTISIAIPGSILENAQSLELRTYLAGQIARAACIYRIDEVIVYDDIGTSNPKEMAAPPPSEDESEFKAPVRKSCLQMARILQYLECPQYLRRFFFPMHQDLQYAGLLNPLDTPHHLRQSEDFPYREGIVSTQQKKNGHSVVNVGLLQNVSVNQLLEAGLRVTVYLLPPKEGSKKLRGRIVTPQTPEADTGQYWGYSVRIASSITAVFSQGPYSQGYDLTIGTSEKGESIDQVLGERRLPSAHRHALVVLGGLNGLEAALEADSLLQVDDPSLLFEHYLNVCPDQGSRTIRTEEALLITLATLRPFLGERATTLKDSVNGKKAL